MDIVLHNINIYNQYVQEYIARFMDLNLYKHTFHYLLETLPPNANVLELGCGPGNVVKYLSSERPDLHFLGVDLSPEMIKALKNKTHKQNSRLWTFGMHIRLRSSSPQLSQPFAFHIFPFTIYLISLLT